MKMIQFKHSMILFILIGLFSCSTFQLLGQNHIQALDIIQEIDQGQDVTYENVTIQGDLDFSLLKNKSKGGSYGVRSGVVKEYIGSVTSNVTFKNCTFLGEVATFNESRVPGVRKENFTWFEAPVVFDNCRFKERVQFIRMKIKESLSITDCDFENDIRFDRIGFSKKPVFQNNRIDGSFTNKRTNWIAEENALESEKPRNPNAVFVKLKNSSLKRIQIRFESNRWSLSPLGTSGLNSKVGQEIYIVRKGQEDKLLLKVKREMDGQTIDISKLDV